MSQRVQQARQAQQATGVHAGQPVLTAGAALSQASAALILIHGRGSSAENMLGLASELTHPRFAFLAPQAAGGTWYPYRFMEPLEKNEPYLSSALSVIEALVAHVKEAGIPAAKVMLLGFSQGACLTLEYAARHAQRYGGVVGLSGGLIGPDDTSRDYAGSFNGTPVFLGCSDVDFHIPVERVHESTAIFQHLGAQVNEQIYPGMDHTINTEEIEIVRGMMAQMVVMKA